jgi:hypothetical protein
LSKTNGLKECVKQIGKRVEIVFRTFFKSKTIATIESAQLLNQPIKQRKNCGDQREREIEPPHSSKGSVGLNHHVGEKYV